MCEYKNIVKCEMKVLYDKTLITNQDCFIIGHLSSSVKFLYDCFLITK